MVDRNDARNVGLHDALNVRVVPPHPPARPVRLALLQPVRHLPVLVLSVLAHVLVGSEVRVRAASADQGRLARGRRGSCPIHAWPWRPAGNRSCR